MFAMMAIVRWLPAHVPLITFHANVLLASTFAGMACGFALAARSAHGQYVSAIAAVGLFIFARLAEYAHEQGVVWNTAIAKDVFFGHSRTTGNVEATAIPLEVVLTTTFILVALMFVGPAKSLGCRLVCSRYSASLTYAAHLLGGIGGVVLFAAAGAAQLSATWWLAAAIVGLALTETTSRQIGGAAIVWVLAYCVSTVDLPISRAKAQELWSPYYRVQVDNESLSIRVNMLSHQQMVAAEGSRLAYSLPYLLRRDAGDRPARDVAIIGAGAGNDVSHALAFGVDEVTAIELDPVLAALGQRHPDRPYADPRTVLIVDDGRRFLQTTQKRFDLVVYGFVDSLINQSSFASLRFEGYLYTAEAWAQVRRTLRPGGQLVIYEFFRTGWALGRLVGALDREFGNGTTLAITLPHIERLSAEDSIAGFWSIIIAGDTALLKDAFAKYKTYHWRHSSTGMGANGFVDRDLQANVGVTVVSQTQIECCRETSVVKDSWPFPYTRRQDIRIVPWRTMALIAVCALALVSSLLGSRMFELSLKRWRVYLPLFGMGCAFMLLESRLIAIATVSFGTTYLVTAAVVAAVLFASLTGVLWEAGLLCGWKPSGEVKTVLLAISVCASAFFPAHTLLARGGPLSWLAVCVLVCPVVLAGSAFAHFYAKSDRAIGLAVNGLGAVAGSQLENLVLLVGTDGVAWLIACLYVLVAVSLLLERRSLGDRPLMRLWVRQGWLKSAIGRFGS